MRSSLHTTWVQLTVVKVGSFSVSWAAFSILDGQHFDISFRRLLITLSIFTRGLRFDPLLDNKILPTIILVLGTHIAPHNLYITIRSNLTGGRPLHQYRLHSPLIRSQSFSSSGSWHIRWEKVKIRKEKSKIEVVKTREKWTYSKYRNTLKPPYSLEKDSDVVQWDVSRLSQLLFSWLKKQKAKPLQKKTKINFKKDIKPTQSPELHTPTSKMPKYGKPGWFIKVNLSIQSLSNIRWIFLLAFSISCTMMFLFWEMIEPAFTTVKHKQVVGEQDVMSQYLPILSYILGAMLWNLPVLAIV